MKRIIAMILALVMALSLVACGTDNVNENAVKFSVVVTDRDGSSNTFEYTTTASTVGEALLNEGLISGDEGDYGLYVTTVNGITADWDADQTYWAFYIDGEYALTGVEATEVTEGTVYSFVLTGYVQDDTTGTDATEAEDIQELGEGETVFALSVVDLDGVETAYEVHTNETTVGAALVALGVIDGTVSEYGLYVTTVNGITADWDADQTYWAFYIDGEYALTGVDATEIDAGNTYSLVLTKG